MATRYLVLVQKKTNYAYDSSDSANSSDSSDSTDSDSDSYSVFRYTYYGLKKKSAEGRREDNNVFTSKIRVHIWPKSELQSPLSTANLNIANNTI
ncbi:hypothetical protein C1646_761664 [Rhizophagus diaphanus]|nr:hypothetical protein C1646_761664 [Rhizophagus diaphanus] [Rhizophagus sp. MUCL 43196]